MIWFKLDELVVQSFDQLELDASFSLRKFTVEPLKQIREGFRFTKTAWSNGDKLRFEAISKQSQLSHLSNQNRARIVLLWIALEVDSMFLVVICKLESI